MVTATVNEVQNNFEKYLNEIMSGNEVNIIDGNKKIAKIMPSMEILKDYYHKKYSQEHYEESTPKVKRIGVAEGKIKIPDDFDKWDSEIEEMFGDNIK